MRIFIVVIVVLASCTKHNPNVCCTDQADCDAQGLPLGSTCSDGLICRGNQCIAETCTNSSMCDAAAPYCVSELCGGSCTADEQCPGFSEAADDTFCVGGTCVQCREAMDDCPSTTPICDANVCRGCVLDDDCASRVCAATTGVCVSASNILYASPDGLPATDCSLGAPCTVATALSLVGGAKSTIRMLPGSYPVNLVVAAGVTGTIVGTGATLTGTAGAGDLLSTDANTNLAVRGLSIQPLGSRQIHCSSSNVASTLQLSDVSTATSLNADNCHLALTKTKLITLFGNGPSTLTIDRSDVQELNMNFMQNGVITVTNSVIRGTIELPTSSPYSIQGLVSFSTFGMVPGSINCIHTIAAVTFANDIFQQDPSINAPNVVAGDSICYDHNIEYPQATPLGSHITVADPKLLDQTHFDYHIKVGSPAIDVADPVATDAVDFDGVSRPQGAGRDLGAFEFH